MIVKVAVRYNTNKIDYDLNREENLFNHLRVLCARLQAPGDPSQYCLQVDATRYYIEEGDLSRVELSIPAGSLLVLRLKPAMAVQSALAALRESSSNPKQRSIQIFELRNSLKDEIFARQFLQQGGITQLTNLIGSLTGNTLAYALSALQEAMSYGSGWDDLSQAFIDEVVNFTESSNLNVCRSALEILLHLCMNPKYGVAVLGDAFSRKSKQNHKPPFHNLVHTMNSTDLNIQLNGLTLINALIEQSRTNKEKLNFMKSLDSLGINQILKKNLNSTDPEFRHQIFVYQRHRLGELRMIKEEVYNRENEEHENLLMRLWKSTFPNTPLENRVSEQWKLMGFQGTDPATDFRGMGLLGLVNLVYFAEEHGDTFRKIVNEQAERKERDYPVAVAGINVTQMLFDLFQIGNNGTIYNCLFDHPKSFDEIYCIALRVLDTTWDEMNASYMDFPRVIAAVKKQMGDALNANYPTIEQLNRGVTFAGPRGRSQSTALNEEEEIAEPEPYKQLRAEVKAEIMRLVKEQKKGWLQQGCCFRIYKPKAKQLPYIYCKLVDNQLCYAPVQTPDIVPETLPSSQCQSISTGVNTPVFSKQKKLTPQEEEVAALSFTIHTEDLNKSLDLVALNQDDFSNWTDGLRVLIHDRFENPQTQEEFKTLVSIELRIRLLDLAGVQTPQEAPQIPPLPPNFVTQ